MGSSAAAVGASVAAGAFQKDKDDEGTDHCINAPVRSLRRRFPLSAEPVLEPLRQPGWFRCDVRAMAVYLSTKGRSKMLSRVRSGRRFLAYRSAPQRSQYRLARFFLPQSWQMIMRNHSSLSFPGRSTGSFLVPVVFSFVPISVYSATPPVSTIYGDVLHKVNNLDFRLVSP